MNETETASPDQVREWQEQGYRQGQESNRGEIDEFAARLAEKYGDLTDRQLLLLVIGWQLNANNQIAGLVEHGRKLMENPMIASMMGALD